MFISNPSTATNVATGRIPLSLLFENIPHHHSNGEYKVDYVSITKQNLIRIPHCWDDVNLLPADNKSHIITSMGNAKWLMCR